MISKNNFFNEYLKLYSNCLNKLDMNLLSSITNLIKKKIKNKKKIFVCGNGGSASISNHFLCDFNKGIKKTSKLKLTPKVISLSNSIETILATANDHHFNYVFSDQLENLANKDDLVITFSCSGSSKNITEVVKFAKRKKMKIISFIGFKNVNKIKKNEIIFSLNVNNYGIAEDIFQLIMHMISQSIRSSYIKNFNINRHLM